MTAVEFLAEKYNYVTWMRNRGEISAGTADDWRAKFLKEAKDMERNQNGNDFIANVSGSFLRLNEWFECNANSFGELNGQELYEEKEAKRLCIKLVKEIIESVRQNDFHFKSMSDLEVAEYLLK